MSETFWALLTIGVYSLGMVITATVGMVLKLRSGLDIQNNPWPDDDKDIFIIAVLFWPVALAIFLVWGTMIGIKNISVKLAWIFAGEKTKANLTIKVLQQMGEEKQDGTTSKGPQ